MSVEGIPQRDTTVTFTKHFASYNAGEAATFTAEEAQRLANLGVTSDSAEPSTDPPAVVDVPYVGQVGTDLNCTMGNWTGTPDTYAYQWKSDATNVGTDSATYALTAVDEGHTLACVVTATNANGSTAAPQSNGVYITPAARTEAAAAADAASVEKRKSK